MKTELEILGHKVSSEGLNPLENKVKAIKEWKAPSNIHELRSFLGAIGYYRNFSNLVIASLQFELIVL